MVRRLVGVVVMPAVEMGVEFGFEVGAAAEEGGEAGDVVHDVEGVDPVVAFGPALEAAGPGAVGVEGFHECGVGVVEGAVVGAAGEELGGPCALAAIVIVVGVRGDD